MKNDSRKQLGQAGVYSAHCCHHQHHHPSPRLLPHSHCRYCHDDHRGHHPSTSNIISTMTTPNTAFSPSYHNHHYHHHYYIASVRTPDARERMAKGQSDWHAALKKVLFGELLNHPCKVCHTHLSVCTKMAPPNATCCNKCHRTSDRLPPPLPHPRGRRARAGRRLPGPTCL